MARVTFINESTRTAPYERSANRVSYANGYKDKALKTPVGNTAAESATNP